MISLDLFSSCFQIYHFLMSHHPAAPPTPAPLCNRHKYLCRYVTHIRLQYFRLFPVLDSKLSRSQLSGSYRANAPCLHAHHSKSLPSLHKHTHTHTFQTKGKLCICQGYGTNKGEVRCSAVWRDEHLSPSWSYLHSTHAHIFHSPFSLYAALLRDETEAVIG